VDDEETSFYYMRPIVLNGIEELATRGISWIGQLWSRFPASTQKTGFWTLS